MFKGVFRNFGLFKKDAKVIFVGLDNAGKTSLMSVLKYGEIRQFDPTIFAFSEEIEIGSLRVNMVDLGGHDTVRKVWKNYFPNVDGIIYLVDAAKPSRFEESKVEFEGIMGNPDIGDVPVLVLGNKIDMKGAVNQDELVEALGLVDQSNYGNRVMESYNGKPIKVCMCSIAKKMGFKPGLEWLEKQIE